MCTLAFWLSSAEMLGLDRMCVSVRLWRKFSTVANPVDCSVPSVIALVVDSGTRPLDTIAPELEFVERGMKDDPKLPSSAPPGNGNVLGSEKEDAVKVKLSDQSMPSFSSFVSLVSTTLVSISTWGVLVSRRQIG